MGSESSYPTFKVGDHEAFMKFALIQAQKPPPQLTSSALELYLLTLTRARFHRPSIRLSNHDIIKETPARRMLSNVASSRLSTRKSSSLTSYCARPWSRATRDSAVT
ncbi:hypothetical protein F5Y09DRAFT_211142 [Xylaria sp. FL1042]|nr:hypothetical protein F5Y09DRAFT_211142 [Xylaria sp. FL1042]